MKQSLNHQMNSNQQKSVKACGIVYCYNEAQIIEETLVYYLSQGLDLVVFDNDSTDGSRAIAAKYQSQPDSFSGKVLDVVDISTTGYEWKKILQTSCEYMHAYLSKYNWIILIDADGFYESPIAGFSLQQFLNFVQNFGYNMVDGALYMFYPTARDDQFEKSAVKRIRYCEPHPNSAPVQQRIFRYHPSIDFFTHGAHKLIGDGLRECPIKFIYKHYVWLSYEHGQRKIFEERRPRYIELAKDPNLYFHHLPLLPIESDFVKDYRELWRFDLARLQISERQLSFRMKFQKIFEILFSIKRKACFRKKRLLDSIETFRRVYAYNPARAIRLAIPTIYKKIIISLKKQLGLLHLNAVKSKDISDVRKFEKRNAFQAVDGVAIAEQKAVLRKLPTHYAFLMTDFCNVRCNFCNQDFIPKAKNSISLDSFKLMLSNIPETKPCHFSYSGGGEPLLCPDLIPIMNHVSQTRPWIKTYLTTNGLLLKKFSDDLAQSSLDELWVSIHGSTDESNRQILRTKSKQSVFEGVAEVNRRLKERGNERMSKVFYMVVSRANIEELPDLIRRASELNVEKVLINFVRYYPWDAYRFENAGRPDSRESLFYEKDLYNDVVTKSKKLAKSLGVHFDYEPLFGKKFSTRSCGQPWQRMVIDVDGSVYPCLGGEAWFRDKVKSGEYSFGNILEQHALAVWNSEGYVRSRRSCRAGSKENLMPECKDCHQSMCLVGPDAKYSHFFEMPHFPSVDEPLL